PRSRIDRDHARGGGGVQKAGDALLDRQGFVRYAASCRQGLPSWKAALSADAHRYDLEIPGNDLISRSDCAASWRKPDRAYQRGRPRARRRSALLRLVTSYPSDEDRRTQTGAR